MNALETYIAAAGVTAGPVFRNVNRHGQLSAERLTAQSVALIIKRAAIAAGIDSAKLSGHSLRAGAATERAMRGGDSSEVRRLGRWNRTPPIATFDPRRFGRMRRR